MSELTADLASKSDDIESLKTQMADRNQSMTDTSPLRLIKQALQNLKNEIKQMELRIGVASQTLLQVMMQSDFFFYIVLKKKKKKRLQQKKK